MAYSVGGIDLPPGLLWIDEYTYSAYEQAISRGLTGSLVVELAPKLAGRPLTLAGAEDRGWMTQETLDALFASAADDPPPELTLILPDARSFTVRWDYSGPPIAIDPIVPWWPTAGKKYFRATLRFFIV